MNKLNLLLSTTLSIYCLNMSGTLLAEEIELASTITAATVYDDRAAITRAIKAQFNQGASTLIIKDLPGNVLIDSLRVRGNANNKIEIASVEAKYSFTKNSSNQTEAEIREKILNLQDQRKEYQDQIEALDLQKTFITSLIQTQPKIMREEMEIGNLDPVQWQTAWSLIQSGSSDMLKTRSTAVIAQREIDKEIGLLNQQLSKLSTGQKRTIDAYIAIETQSLTNGTLYLDYQIPGASWRPMYDARLDTENSKLRLDQLASVTQTTGEDWSNIQLTLSTHRPSVNAAFNPLTPWILKFQEQYSRRSKAKVNSQAMAPVAYEVDAVMDEMVSTGFAMEEKEDSVMRNAVVSSSAFSAEYQIPGRISLVSERNARKFKIKDQSFDTELLVMAAPQRSTKAYLHAQLNYAGDEPLLPGNVSLFRDDAFVGNTHLALLRPDEDMKLSFGIDDAVKIEYKTLKEEKGTNGLMSKRDYIERNFKTIVHNYHKQDIDIRILNRLPIAQHEDIKVEINDKNSKATESDLNDLKGVMAWDFDLKPGQENTIDFGYTISYPAGRVVY